MTSSELYEGQKPNQNATQAQPTSQDTRERKKIRRSGGLLGLNSKLSMVDSAYERGAARTLERRLIRSSILKLLPKLPREEAISFQTPPTTTTTTTIAKMSHCHDEHHDHSHGGHDEHDHSDDITPALQHSLYGHVNFDEVTALNESQIGSARAVVKKTWAERLDPEPEVVSDADEQLLVNVPFTGQVKLHALLLRTSDSPSAPRTLKLFANRDDLDFASAEDAHATQEFELSRTSQVQEIPVKRALFGRVQRLTLFFVDNFGDGDEDETRLGYLGFKGEWMQLGRAPTNILYEAAANPSDHKIKGTGVNEVGGGIGGRQ
ncbi:60s ribosomal protein l3 [Colletotrichum higginsianum IMI 349063]|uniref:60s ribosomal protein l3 n=4 Tax=Colletotrichum destructivum species complex TaxID=2707350 RepID=A0A1B7XUU9_COLHI|nr:60s ribosomal protein l3 [Colletotrichum higginsianum IMI 349063]OBR03526.1 60s ribosomal protein l3 [Colletotrichum higginsianum IMI 349063]